MNADSFDGILRKSYPVPKEIYPRAKWMDEAAEACSLLSRLYRREASALMLTIQSNEILSDEYELVGVYRPYATVNADLLRKKEPEVFEACVHVKQWVAEEVLGRRRLYELVCEVLGDSVGEYEVVNVSDVRRLLPSSEAALYVNEGDEFVKYRVIEKGGSV